jgi:hypothetical protein
MNVETDRSAEPYRRLALIDPPAMRSLIVELSRISAESSALAMRTGTPEAAARAGRDAQRAADAHAALASTSTERS